VESTSAKKRWDDVASVQEWESFGNIELGPHTSFQYRNDPRHLCFVLSRYKFCAKLLSGRKNVAEIGCGDAFGTALVAQSVEKLLAIDWDARLVESNIQRLDFLANCTFRRQDVVAVPLEGEFDAVYSLDVIEHIDQSLEDAFLRHSCENLTSDGVYIMGTPNVTSEAYASQSSRLGHINMKDAAGLREMLEKYFNTVFIFSMNDEVVHTGFYPMAHYLFGVGVGRKKEA
jgi:2-polyprenyl-3-methyl-5-hydroxy-6-metoxy-1,4-benzoquinol methylase